MHDRGDRTGQNPAGVKRLHNQIKYMVRHWGTWALHLSGAFSLSQFFYENPGCYCFNCISCAESPDSNRIGVIGVLVHFFPHLRPSTINFTLPGWPSNGLIHWDVVEYSEVADFVHARTSSNKKMSVMDGLRYSRAWWPLLQSQTWACPYVSLCSSTWDWWLGQLPRSSGIGEVGDW